MAGDATRCKPAPDNNLGLARRVNIGRVDEIASANKQGTKDLNQSVALLPTVRRAPPHSNHAYPAAMYSSRIANAVSSEH